MAQDTAGAARMAPTDEEMGTLLGPPLEERMEELLRLAREAKK